MQSEIRSIVRPLEKAWLTTTMLGEVLARALKDGCWDDVDNYSELGLRKEIDIDLDKCSIVVVDDENGNGSESQSPKRGKEQAGEQGYNGREEAKGKTSLSNGANSTVNDILAVLTHDGPLGIVHAWLLLPLLPVLLTHGSFRSSQRALMSLNVLLKTDEGQCATLSALPDRSWVRLFVATALISERGRLSALAQAESLKKKATTAAVEPAGSDPTAQSDLLTPTSGSETGADMHNSPKMTVSSSFGSVSRWGLMTEEDWRVEAEVAATSAELALDSVATVLESKMRYSGT
jgi:hypothetical protein